MMHRSIRAVIVVLVSSVLGACGGPHGMAVPPVRQTSAKDVRIVIHWTSTSSAAAVRKPAFLSPSAQSITIGAAPAGSTDLSAVVTTVANKPSTGSGTSTVSIDAPLGSDTFAFTVFDAPNGTGNKLGGATVTQTITAGAANTVSATLDGYAHGFAISSADTRLHPESGDTSGGLPVYAVAGSAQLTFSVSALDTDGNIILGPGAPAISATSDTPSYLVSAVSGQTNTFTIQAVAPAPEATVPHLILSAPGTDGTTYSAEYALLQIPLLYVSAGSGSSAHIYAYDTEGTSYTLPGSFAGMSQPVGLAYDTVNHRLYVADAGTQSVLAFDQNGNAVSSWTPPSVQGITAIAFSTHVQHIYATTTAGGGAVRAFDTSGAPVTASGAFAGLQAPPVGIAYDAGVNLLAVVQSGAQGYVTEYNEDGSAAADPTLSYALTDSNDGSVFSPTGIGSDNVFQGNFWVTGVDHSDGNSYLAYLCNGSCEPRTFVVPDVNGYFYGGSTKQNIDAALSVVQDPANRNDDVYVVNGVGGLAGFTCGSQLPVGAYGFCPQPISGIPGEVSAIAPPAGVSNFTAAAFGDL